MSDQCRSGPPRSANAAERAAGESACSQRAEVWTQHRLGEDDDRRHDQRERRRDAARQIGEPHRKQQRDDERDAEHEAEAEVGARREDRRHERDAEHGERGRPLA